MFSSPKNTGGATATGNSSNEQDMEFSLHSDYFGGDFVEDGSFLVLNTDGLSLSPSTPPENKEEVEVETKPIDIEIVNGEDGFETPSASITKSQVLGEDPESSVESSHSRTSIVKQNPEKGPTPSSSVIQPETALQSLTNMSMASNSTSASTDANLIESGEEVKLLMEENKKLSELLTASNEKMKQCITASEKLNAEHEEYKKKNEASRELINQLRKDNETLKSQLAIMQSKPDDSDLSQSLEKDRELAAKQESLQRHYHTITELNERLKTVLTVNGQINDQLLTCQKENEVMRGELELLRSEHESQMVQKADALRKIEVMSAEVDSGRQAILKFKERHAKYEDDLACAKSRIQSLEEIVEEKTKLTDSLRRNMEDTVTALERCNQKLNEKEREISLLTTKLAAIHAETDVSDQLQALQLQCQTYLSDFEKMRDERDKLLREKDAIMAELQEKTNALERLNRQQDTNQTSTAASAPRNDNSAANANEPLASPLTSLPSVAGQLVGFVRRELLGWEDQGGATEASNRGSGATGSSETVVQQPKQEAIPPCPLCRRQFASLERLQTHASNCGIENSGEPDDPFVFP